MLIDLNADSRRCLQALDLPRSDLEIVWDRLVRLSSLLDQQQVLKLLTLIEGLEENLQAAMGNVNFALEKADVLAYTPGEKCKGILLQKIAAMRRLGWLLEIQPNEEIVMGMLNAISGGFYLGKLERN